jgi:hypothetical protein
MDKNYLKIIDKAKFAAADIGKLLDYALAKTFEDKQMRIIFERLLENLQSAADSAERFTKPVMEGRLEETDMGKFEFISNAGKGVARLSCGSPLEVYSEEEGEWFCGSVEYKNGHYCFCSSDLGHPALYAGMKARIRE